MLKELAQLDEFNVFRFRNPGEPRWPMMSPSIEVKTVERVDKKGEEELKSSSSPPATEVAK